MICKCLAISFLVLTSGCLDDIDVGGSIGNPCPSGRAFCSDFTIPLPGGRGGDLDEAFWSVARIGARVNPTQSELNVWIPTQAAACGTTRTVLADDDVFICKSTKSGRAEVASPIDDQGGNALHSFRARKPFDFADRVGTIALDIDGKTRTPEGPGYWWNIVVSEEPLPAPNPTMDTLKSRHAVLLEFHYSDVSDGTENELSHVAIEDNYAVVREYKQDQTNAVPFKTADDVLNHVEVRISEDAVEVWATDLDDLSTFRKVGSVSGIALGFTRGYVNIQHAQYNAANAGVLPSYATYHLGSFSFDGPSIPTPRVYEVPDAHTDLATGQRNLGYDLSYMSGGVTETSVCCPWKQIPSFALAGIDLTGAKSARLNLDAWFFATGKTIDYRWNGGPWQSFADPWPGPTLGFAETPRAVTIPISLSDLRPGENTLEMKATGADVTASNVELEIEIN
jgi:hypothetical protein